LPEKARLYRAEEMGVPTKSLLLPQKNRLTKNCVGRGRKRKHWEVEAKCGRPGQWRRRGTKLKKESVRLRKGVSLRPSRGGRADIGRKFPKWGPSESARFHGAAVLERIASTEVILPSLRESRSGGKETGLSIKTPPITRKSKKARGECLCFIP